MQIRRGREADTERLVALAGQIFETEQEIPRALTLAAAGKPPSVVVRGGGRGASGRRGPVLGVTTHGTWAASSSPRNCKGVMLGPRCWKRP